MRPLILILSLSLLTFSGFAQQQNPSNKKLGITFTAVGDNDVSTSNALDGAGSTYGEGFFSIGLSYQQNLSKNWLKFKTGLEYSHQKIRTESAPYSPEIEKTITHSNFSLITIPVTLKARFLKFLFLEGGGIVDVYTGPDARIDSQAGLGVELGYGIQYEMNSGWMLTITHYARMHALLSFMGEDQHLWENGLRFGVHMPFSVISRKEK
ncbi:outer membrane beta-barrel protein [Marinilabilia salmonicolor]|jgi:hypothetical protein|uniref:Outer membrane protein with beta-barrel domain n=1 Tax=Marinilabilia salmonicolor TaxID=989 RepID=A0A2T0XDC4_9BACT|nr:outer membrane beta-barrel protein [Marinilabilia salmonicolor]PRY96944.1 outer membrane protein with beta-barrel domain [Marinilabilia salmonicolor]RCW36646.1 outer membrane protein with beta-barrel domain [Marinilabilia salmonicolor]